MHIQHKIYIALWLVFLIHLELSAQGCVAIRNMSCAAGTPTANSGSAQLQKGQWQTTLGYRHFRSFRHFRGNHEETERVAGGTEVINLFNSVDFGLFYGISNRLSLAVSLPLVFNDRSSLYEHYGNSETANPGRNRFHTQSSGIGDLRVGANFWVLDPMVHHKGNFSVGLGVKAPTGNPAVMDDFHKLDDQGNDYIIRQAVDQSIQLGDGGWGINLELQAYRQLGRFSLLYFNGFYLSNPRNINNTLRRAGQDPEDPFSYLSVADQYAARLGVSVFPLPGLGVSMGGRLEGIPAHDIIGKEEGFRRPGYIISVEPGLLYTTGKVDFGLNVPIALVRDRIRNVQDIRTGRHGDAAFADYLINATIAYRFGGKQATMPHEPVFKDAPGVQ